MMVPRASVLLALDSPPHALAMVYARIFNSLLTLTPGTPMSFGIVTLPWVVNAMLVTTELIALLASARLVSILFTLMIPLLSSTLS
jgi:hypothetical protein